MEQYREKLKISQRITTLAAVVLMAFSVLFLLAEKGVIRIAPIHGDDHWIGLWRGFMSGASMGIAVLMLIALLRMSKALRNEKVLKKFYVQANDERRIKIWTSARALSMQIFLILGLVAGLIIGYFSMQVGLTMIVCVVVHSLIALGCKLYYSRKF